jgi:hypothetical protein
MRERLPILTYIHSVDRSEGFMQDSANVLLISTCMRYLLLYIYTRMYGMCLTVQRYLRVPVMDNEMQPT